MKKKNLVLIIFSAFIYVSLISYSKGGKILSDENGTGAKDGQGGCSCHGPQESPELNISVELDSAGVPVNHYVGGKSYTIKITGKNNSAKRLTRFGFRIAAVKSKGAGTSAVVNAGVISPSLLPQDCRNTSIGSFYIVEQKNQIRAKGNGGPGTLYEKSIPWTAPETGTGEVKLYGVLLAVNGDRTDKGDIWNKTNINIPEGEPQPAISSGKSICVKQTSQLLPAKAGGAWVSSDPGIVSVDATGTIYGNAQGNAIITYTNKNYKAMTQVTVNNTPVVAPIEGVEYVCTGSQITLNDKSAGGNWSVNNNTIAFVSETGVVSGISEGAAEITYTITNACGTDKKGKTVNVHRTPDAGYITAPKTDLCVDESVMLSSSVPGGIWTGNNDIAGIGTNGIVKAIREGSVTIFYTLRINNCAGVAEKTLNFHPSPPEGAISGPPEIKVGDHRTFISRGTGGFWSIDYKNGNGNAIITSNGDVYGVKEGETGIIYSVQNGICWNVVKHKIKIVKRKRY